MRRKDLKNLQTWLKSPSRKPLILRGARQVGKSTLVRLFCEKQGLDLLEINLEIEVLNSIKKEEFSLQSLLDEIQFKKKKRIQKNTLIFFDEIQEVPKLLKFLRYFYEQKPDLIVVAAGSLLEIALTAEKFSFPVGRVEFYYLGPMTFREFLWATKQDYLDEKLDRFEFSEELHDSAIRALRNYFYTGGMPEAIKEYVRTDSLLDMGNIQEQILQTYRADFPKYNRRINIDRISRIFSVISLFVGEKIIYSKLDAESASRDIKRVVELLFESRVLLSCIHSDGNGVPLEGESDSRIFKSYFLDIGLLNALLRLDLETVDTEFKNKFNTKGVLAEQFVAQHLNFFQGPRNEPRLVYHLKDKGSQKAEVDFLIEKKEVYPIKVKSSASGHLKSLKYFCESKRSKMAFKLSLDKFSMEKNFVNSTKLINLPLYAVEYLNKNIENLQPDD